MLLLSVIDHTATFSQIGLVLLGERHGHDFNERPQVEEIHPVAGEDVDKAIPVLLLPAAEAVRIVEWPAVEMHAAFGKGRPTCQIERSLHERLRPDRPNPFHQVAQSILGAFRSGPGSDHVGGPVPDQRLEQISLFTQFFNGKRRGKEFCGRSAPHHYDRAGHPIEGGCHRRFLTRDLLQIGRQFLNRILDVAGLLGVNEDHGVPKRNAFGRCETAWLMARMPNAKVVGLASNRSWFMAASPSQVEET